MANQFEVSSFVTKLMTLRESGRSACLTLDCKEGEIIINLQLHLDREADHHGTHHPKPSPSRLRRRARRELARATAAVNAAAAKETAEKAAVPPPTPSKVDVAVQAATPAPRAVDAAVQAVEQTLDRAVQAGPPPHQEGRSSQGVLGLAEQADIPLHHHLEDLLCHDREYLPALGQLADRGQYRVDRERERKEDLDNFTKMLDDSFKM